jgi:hypothetical protein
MFLAQRVNWNVTANEEDYSAMWTKAYFAVYGNAQRSDYSQMQ